MYIFLYIYLYVYIHKYVNITNIYVLYRTGNILFVYVFICTPTYVSILVCIHICFTLLQDSEVFHDHTHVHTNVHKLDLHDISPF